MSAVSPLDPAQQNQQPLPLTRKFRQAAQMLGEMAIRIFFIIASVFMTAAALPLSWHAVVLPLVGLTATFISGFFFPRPSPLQPPYFDPLSPLLESVPILPPAQIPPLLPPGAPRPLVNVAQNCAFNSLTQMGQNCAFNSLTQFKTSLPLLVEWILRPLTAETNLPALQQFLQEYDCPQEVWAPFQAYMANQPPNNGLTVPVLFREFLAEYARQNGASLQVKELNETYQKILILQGPLCRMVTSYMVSYQRNAPNVEENSQNLREAFHSVSGLIDRSPYVQIDASELVQRLTEVLPRRMQLFFRTTYHFNTNGLPALDGIPNGITAPKIEHHGYFQLTMKEGEIAPSVGQMIRDFMTDHISMEKRAIDGKDHPYPTLVRRELLEAPPFFLFMVKRFYNRQKPESTLTRLCSRFFPPLGWEIGKNSAPVHVPPELEIPLANGAISRYRFHPCFIVHHGATPNSGHYTSNREVQGQKYYMSDEHITQVNQEAWDEALRNIYLGAYVRVQ